MLDLRSSNSLPFLFLGMLLPSYAGEHPLNNGWPEILPTPLHSYASTRASDPIGNAYSDHNLQYVCRGNSTFRNPYVFKMGNFQLPGISPAAEIWELRVFKLARSRNTDLVHCFITGWGEAAFLDWWGKKSKIRLPRRQAFYMLLCAVTSGMLCSVLILSNNLVLHKISTVRTHNPGLK